MIIEKLRSDLIEGQKARDTIRVETIRFLLSALKYFHIDKYGAQKIELPDEDVITVIRKQVKQREESIDAFKKGNRSDLVEKEEKELAILRSYLPAELTDEEIEKVVKEVVASGQTAFGAVMGASMGKLKGKVSGDRVSAVVKNCLHNGKLP